MYGIFGGTNIVSLGWRKSTEITFDELYEKMGRAYDQIWIMDWCKGRVPVTHIQKIDISKFSDVILSSMFNEAGNDDINPIQRLVVSDDVVVNAMIGDDVYEPMSVSKIMREQFRAEELLKSNNNDGDEKNQQPTCIELDGDIKRPVSISDIARDAMSFYMIKTFTGTLMVDGVKCFDSCKN